MSFPNQPTPIFPAANFKSKAIAIFEQIDNASLERMEHFIAENFKFPKGGGWDLDSLWENILFQHDLNHKQDFSKWLPQEIAKSQALRFHPSEAEKFIKNEILWRYRPKMESDMDQELLKNLVKLFYAMDAIRLALFEDQIPATAFPTEVLLYFR